MSLSLSSLLNPSPDAETARSPPTRQQSRAESLPHIQYVQSSEHRPDLSPQNATSALSQYARSPSTDQDAVQALAALSNSNTVQPTQSAWYEPGRSSSSSEQRPGSSGHHDTFQLPPPRANSRTMSSPTLEQYQVASRSPEQRRASLLSPHPTPTNFTLPPIQSYSSAQHNQSRRVSAPYEQVIQMEPSPTTLARDPNAAINAPNSSLHGHPHPSHHTPTNDLQRSPPTTLHVTTSNTAADVDVVGSAQAIIKQEHLTTPLTPSPLETHHASGQQGEMDTQTPRNVANLKFESGVRNQSPLRESSVPIFSTEMPASESSNSKKREAPSKTKKGTATMTKKAPPSKKRKVEPKRSGTPSSLTSKSLPFKTASGKGTPANSSPAPSTRSHSVDATDEPYDEEDEEMEDGDSDADGDVYCICRKPDSGTFMIGCDGTCDDWFHGKCVSIDERDKNLIDKYVCPNCTEAGIGRTTWKRMCRRSGCRQPARIGKTKNSKNGSKYCSDECGVMFFRDHVARTRGREEVMKNRSSRRKGNTNPVQSDRTFDDDLGARGGVLSAGELKSLINSCQSAEDFKRLGGGVLSPPATPDGKGDAYKNRPSEFSDTDAEILDRILRSKEDARRKHQLLKDRMKFVTMLKQAAARTAMEKDLKPKEYCGYDSRIQWTEEQFEAWRSSPHGQRALELETLATEKSTGDGDEMDVDVPDNNPSDDDYEICDRKKCARHLEWPKLAVDDVRFEMGDNSDRMRALDREERELRQRAALRAKAGNLDGEGSVEVHGLGVSIATAEGVDDMVQ